MPEPTNTLIAPRFLFRFAVPVKRHDPIWKPSGVDLDESFRLLNLAELDVATSDAERSFADLRLAWSPDGLAFNVTVAGKEQPPWCRDSRLVDSDGLSFWIDTRATLNIHRASRYCHRFAFLPAGAGRGHAEPVADQLLINRARENARPVRAESFRSPAKSKKTATGWRALSRPTPWGATTRSSIVSSASPTRCSIANVVCKHLRRDRRFRLTKIRPAGRF